MTLEGFAHGFVKNTGLYVCQMIGARNARRNLWVGVIELLREFRAHKWKKAAQGAPDKAHEACPIKGNITRKGERIYHMPWQVDYARTKVTESRGEAWFCDERQAIEAGFRRAAR